MSGYVPCDKCHYVPPETDFPSFVRKVRTTTETWHRADCPTVPQVTAEQRAEYLAWLEDYRACMRRAWASAQTYVIG